jgi:GDP-L-fucose synthase
MARTEKVLVAGHRGMVGGAIARRLAAQGRDVLAVARDDLDLTDQAAVRGFLARERPDAVVLAAARVGGIAANTRFPAEFLAENLQIANNVITAAHAAGVARLLYVASSAIYPQGAEQPIGEGSMLTGPLDPSHEAYALAKIAGIKLCEAINRQYGADYRSIVPTNLYGPGDNFHSEHAHVVPALVRRFHEAARDRRDAVVLWGSGRPRREILHVDDMAEAALHVLDLPAERWLAGMEQGGAGPGCHVHVGRGEDLSIVEIAGLIARATGYDGAIVCDPSRPDGVMRRLLDVSRLARLGWQARIAPAKGLAETCAWYRDNVAIARIA